MIRIETENIGQNGFQRIDGYVDDYHVIGLRDGVLGDDGKGIWMVSTSSCYSTNVDDAKLMNECAKQVFNKLDEIKNTIGIDTVKDVIHQINNDCDFWKEATTFIKTLVDVNAKQMIIDFVTKKGWNDNEIRLFREYLVKAFDMYPMMAHLKMRI